MVPISGTHGTLLSVWPAEAVSKCGFDKWWVKVGLGGGHESDLVVVTPEYLITTQENNNIVEQLLSSLF